MIRNLDTYPFIWPQYGWDINGGAVGVAARLDAANEYNGGVFKAPKTGTIEKIVVGIGSILIGGDIDVRMETVNTSTGLPTGTLFGTNTNKTYTLVDGTDDETLIEFTLVGAASVTVNDVFAVIVKNAATGFPDYYNYGGPENNGCGGYKVYDTGTATKSGSGTPPFTFVYSDGTRWNPPGTVPLLGDTANYAPTLNNRYGNCFVLPWDAIVSGVFSQFSNSTTADYELFDEDGATVLAKATGWSINVAQTTAATPKYIYFDNDVELKAGVRYRLTYRQTDETVDGYRSALKIQNFADFGVSTGWEYVTQEQGIGDFCYESNVLSASDPTGLSSWTDNKGIFNVIGVIVTQISEPSTDIIHCGDIYAPYWATYQSGAPNLSSVIVDADDEKAAYVIQAPKTGTISKVHVMCVNIPVVPGSDYDVRLETVNTSTGYPTGTLFDTNTNGALTLSSGDDDEWLPVTLTAGASVTRGDDILAVVLVPPASPDNGYVLWGKYLDASYGLPYICSDVGAGWTKPTGGPMVLLEYSDGSIPRIPNCFPWTSVVSHALLYSDSSEPYRCSRFKLREAAEIVGIWHLADMDAPDITATLYEGNSTVRGTLTLKKHHTGGTGGSTTQYAGYFSTSYSASADTLYRASVINNYATASGTPMTTQIASIDPSSIASKIWDHMPYAGMFSEFYRGTSSDLSSWTDYSNSMQMTGPIIRRIW